MSNSDDSAVAEDGGAQRFLQEGVCLNIDCSLFGGKRGLASTLVKLNEGMIAWHHAKARKKKGGRREASEKEERGDCEQGE